MENTNEKVKILLEVAKKTATEGYDKCEILTSDAKIYGLIGTAASDENITNEELGYLTREITSFTENAFNQIVNGTFLRGKAKDEEHDN